MARDPGAIRKYRLFRFRPDANRLRREVWERMSDIKSVMAELQQTYDPDRSYLGRPDHLVDADVERWSRRLNSSRSELYDRIGLYLARGFQNSQLTFEFCDAVVNDLHSVITFADEARPDLFWRVYLAFDEGEYRHENDEPEADPVQTYTQPMVAEIVSEYVDMQLN
jgi:hypothetical protein